MMGFKCCENLPDVFGEARHGKFDWRELKEWQEPREALPQWAFGTIS